MVNASSGIREAEGPAQSFHLEILTTRYHELPKLCSILEEHTLTNHVTMATDFLPPTFLLGPPANPEKKVIDFEKTALPEYKGLYAAVLDGCFSKEECDLLVQAAEAQTNGTWEQAMVNVGGGRQIMATDIRNCGRIIWDDRELVARIWNRINPVMGEIQNLKNQEAVSGLGLVKRREVWEMSRLNERMRFLKYGDGQYFKRTCQLPMSINI